MNLLALDSSTSRATVALAVGSQLVADTGPTVDADGRHGRNLLPTVAALLRLAGLPASRPGRDRGRPGPREFHGLRVGLTAAKTLAFALGKPVVTIDTFEAFARGVFRDAVLTHVVADAQRGDLFAARFGRILKGF